MSSKIATWIVLSFEGLALYSDSFSHGYQNSFDIINYATVTESLTGLSLQISQSTL